MTAGLSRVTIACLGVICVLILGCEDNGPTGPRSTNFFAEAPFSFEMEIGERTTFRIQGINGVVQITGVPGATAVAVEGKRRVESDSVRDAEMHLGQLTVDRTTSEEDIRVRTIQPADTGGRNYIVEYTVTLPPHLEIDARNANGDVIVQSTANEVVARNANGDITVDDVVGDVLATLGNGSITASVTLPLDGIIDMDVGNGSINLAIPQNTSAELSATATNGSVTFSNLNITNPVVTDNSVTGTLGKGHGTISLVVGNGTIGINGVGSVDLSYIYPLDVYSVMQEFANSNPAFKGKYHAAEDAYGMGGTPVYAIADGMISYSGPMEGYGWLITVDHPVADVYSLYGHLSTRRGKVLQGDVVKGQRIAYLADDDEDGSGGAYPDWGPHLHFGVRSGRISDYPDDGDSRWMAGYTMAHPTTLGWMDPTDFIEGHIPGHRTDPPN